MTLNATPTTLLSNHPPLAHDSQGFKLAVPDGATHWRILRHTTGRPRVLLGPDMQPARFGLELTLDQLLDLCGAGKYRIEALDEYGNPLACVTTLTVGASGSDAQLSTELAANNNARTVSTSDARFALETIAQMSRTQSESFQALANAQAEWIKALATAKQLPRNAAVPFSPTVAPSAMDSSDAESTPSWMKLLLPAMPVVANAVMRNLGTWLGNARGSEAPAQRLKQRNAAPIVTISEREREKVLPPSFEEHLAAVCELLPPEDRVRAGALLRGTQPFYGSTFVRTPLMQAVEFVRKMIKSEPTSSEIPS